MDKNTPNFLFKSNNIPSKHFTYFKNFGICTRQETIDGTWSDYSVLIKNTQGNFVVLDSKDNNYKLLYQDLYGNLNLFETPNSNRTILLNKKNTYNNKLLSLIIYKDLTIIIFDTFSNEKNLICCMIEKNKIIDKSFVIDTFETEILTTILINSLLYIFYKNEDNLLGFKNLNLDNFKISQFVKLVESRETLLYSQIILINKETIGFVKKIPKSNLEEYYLSTFKLEGNQLKQELLHSSISSYLDFNIANIKNSIYFYWFFKNSIYYIQKNPADDYWSSITRQSFVYDKNFESFYFKDINHTNNFNKIPISTLRNNLSSPFLKIEPTLPTPQSNANNINLTEFSQKITALEENLKNYATHDIILRYENKLNEMSLNIDKLSISLKFFESKINKPIPKTIKNHFKKTKVFKYRKRR